MRAVVQRVFGASVEVAGRTVGAIGRGLCVFIGAGEHDTAKEVATLADKVAGLRIFPDEAGKMSLSVTDVAGAVLLVSQFTVYGDVRNGRRPSFTAAMAPEPARALYDASVEALRARGITVATGEFGAAMRVQVDNDGPVTILVDTAKAF